jgi:hypothetical protein
MTWGKAALAIWGLVVFYGLAVHFFMHDERVRLAMAARQMPFNHRLAAKDFRDDRDGGLAGTYLRMNAVAGEIITERDVSPTPILGTDPNPWFAIPVPALAALRGPIEPGGKGQICDGTSVIEAAEVVALLCPPHDDGGACVVLVRVAPGDAGKVTTAVTGTSAAGHVIFKTPGCK